MEIEEIETKLSEFGLTSNGKRLSFSNSEGAIFFSFILSKYFQLVSESISNGRHGKFLISLTSDIESMVLEKDKLSIYGEGWLFSIVKDSNEKFTSRPLASLWSDIKESLKGTIISSSINEEVLYLEESGKMLTLDKNEGVITFSSTTDFSSILYKISNYSTILKKDDDRPYFVTYLPCLYQNYVSLLKFN